MSSSERHAAGISHVALLFFAYALVLLGATIGVAWGLMHTQGRVEVSDHLIFPPIFLLSTLLLLTGSYSLQQAVRAVRREKQQRFRRWLIFSMVVAALFMGMQIFGVWSMFPQYRRPEDAVLGVTAPVITLTTLHAVHFWVASLFVCFVTARTSIQRYDHEYYWGVSICAWFWHALGIFWLMILFVFAIVV